MKRLISVCLFILLISCFLPNSAKMISDHPLILVATGAYDDAYTADTIHYAENDTTNGVKIIPMGDSLYVDVCFFATSGARDIVQSASIESDTLVLVLNGDFSALNMAESHYLFRYKFAAWEQQGFYYRVYFNDRWDMFTGCRAIPK